MHQLQAILDGAGVGFLMREDMAIAEGGKFHEGDEAAAMKCFAVMIEDLRVGINRGPTILHEDAGGEPGAQGGVGLGVDFIGTDRFGRGERKIDRDDVVSVAGLEGGFLGIIEHIVRRGDELGELKVCAAGITDAGEGADIGHDE